ncbi:MAG: hypothetical protein BWY82_01492 [Verrucomicrobia bacterium ADurb.Bin474]|nr:MAG: hypothetical protein BWY82_01492 [Verrucomicrobia bacterium ADurb.Bin474]
MFVEILVGDFTHHRRGDGTGYEHPHPSKQSKPERSTFRDAFTGDPDHGGPHVARTHCKESGGCKRDGEGFCAAHPVKTRTCEY